MYTENWSEKELNDAIEYCILNPIIELDYLSSLRFHCIPNWSPILDDMIQTYMAGFPDLEGIYELAGFEDKDIYIMSALDWMCYYEAICDHIEDEVGEGLSDCNDIGDVEFLVQMYPTSYEYILSKIPAHCQVTYDQITSELDNPFTTIWKMEEGA